MCGKSKGKILENNIPTSEFECIIKPEDQFAIVESFFKE